MMIEKRYHFNIIPLFSIAVFAVLVGAGLAACKKESSASATGLNTQLNTINLSPDVLPLRLVLDLTENKKRYNYSVASGYEYLISLNPAIQVRTWQNNTIFDDTLELKPNTRYSLFITGLVSEKTLNHIFVTDTDAVPAAGRGKVRFINALARSATLDVTANGTIAFKAQTTNKVSSYVEMPAGIYDFKILSAGTTSVLYDMPNVTVQDGRLYTLYTRGIVGRTDSAALAAAVITNR